MTEAQIMAEKVKSEKVSMGPKIVLFTGPKILLPLIISAANKAR